MKLLLENWRRYLNEDAPNKLWVIAGPPAVGKSTLMRKIEALEIPNLIIQDMDYIPAVEAATPDYHQLPPEQQANDSPAVYRLSEIGTPKITKGINDFINQHAGKDIFLVGIAWLIPALPFAFPENAEKIYLYRNPADVVQDFANRAWPIDWRQETPTLTDKDRAEAIAGVEEEYQQYEERGWRRMSPDDIVSLVKSSYAEEADEAPI